MCGRYTLYETDEMVPRFKLGRTQQFLSQENYNVAPGQWLPVITQKDSERKVVPMQWGFVPYWSNDPTTERRPINTRAEASFERPYGRHSLKYPRALIPSGGFY